MDICVDLFGCKTGDDVLLRFGEILQFGGYPKGNVKAIASVIGKGWGINWDAFNDCLRDLEAGGIWGSAEKIRFPLAIVIRNYEEFKKNVPQEFSILKDILLMQQEEYKKEGKRLDVKFK